MLPEFLQYTYIIADPRHYMSRRTRASRPFDSSNKRLRVLVDMDQVLCDFEGTFLARYQKKFPDEPFIPLQERNTFYIADQYEKLRTDLQVDVSSFPVLLLSYFFSVVLCNDSAMV